MLTTEPTLTGAMFSAIITLVAFAFSFVVVLEMLRKNKRRYSMCSVKQCENDASFMMSRKFPEFCGEIKVVGFCEAHMGRLHKEPLQLKNGGKIG